MKIHFKIDVNATWKAIIGEQLGSLGINYQLIGMNEIELLDPLADDLQDKLSANLKKYGIEIISTKKSALIQKIKDLVVEMVYTTDKQMNVNFSTYLSEKLNHSSNYLSNLFSEVTYSTIENFIILQKIERAKQLIIMGDLTLTEIAFNLNYCSVAHLSNQFKHNTGLTPTSFQRIIKKRRELQSVS
jgi:AraC-like DNA-binding protein